MFKVFYNKNDNGAIVLIAPMDYNAEGEYIVVDELPTTNHFFQELRVIDGRLKTIEIELTSEKRITLEKIELQDQNEVNKCKTSK